MRSVMSSVDAVLLLRGDGHVGDAVQVVQRQAQLPQHQPGGFVEGVGGAMAEGDAGGVEARGAGFDELDQSHKDFSRFSSVRR